MRSGNSFLDRIPPVAQEALLRHARRREFEADVTLYEPGVPATHAYFPVTAVCSLITELSTGERVETATIGSEGLVGLPAFLETVPTSYAVVQIAGEVIEVDAAHLRECAERAQSLRCLLFEFIAYGLDMTRQSVACNAYHGVDQRLARWLLIAHDRAKSDRMQLTQDYLSSMVAASRPRVSEALGKLKAEGIIDQGRGWVDVQDRPRLERRSCECYRVMLEWGGPSRRTVPWMGPSEA